MQEANIIEIKNLTGALHLSGYAITCQVCKS